MSDVETKCRVSRKYSLGSSVDLVRTQLCLNRHTILRLPITKGMTGQLYLTQYLGLCDFRQVKLRKDLFRQSVLPRLQRADKKHQLSASCGQLRPQDEGPFSMKDNKCR